MRTILTRALRRSALACAMLALAAPAVTRPLAAQDSPRSIPVPLTPSAKKALTIDDYAKWKTIDAAELSGDGKWVAYGTRLTNVPTNASKPALHLLRLDTNQDITVPDGGQPSFSPDSRWVAYIVDPAQTGGGRGGRGAGAPAQPAPVTPPVAPVPGSPPPIVPSDSTPAPDTSAVGRGRGFGAQPPTRRLELRDLASGAVRSWRDVQSASFSPTGSHLLIRFRAPASGTPFAGRGGAGAPDAPPGGAPGGGRGGAGGFGGTPTRADALLVDLRTGRAQFLGSTGDVAFNRMGTLLAYSVDAAARDGNGLFVLDLESGRTTPLDNDGRLYSRLTWNDAGTAIALVKGREVTRMRERDNVLVVFLDVREAGNPELAPATLESSGAAGIPKGFVISERAPLEWSDDNTRVFFGIIPQSAAPDTARRANPDSVADVDVWRAQDERIQSLQMIRAEADRNFTFRQAFDVASRKYVKLTDSTMRDVEIAPDGRWAVGRDVHAYVTDRAPLRTDVYRIDTKTGARTLILKAHLAAGLFGIDPTGHHFLYWKDAHLQSYDLDAGTSKTIGADAPSFVDLEYDHPGEKPSYGIGGYTSDGKGVIVNHKYDLWLVSIDGSAPSRSLTGGAGSKDEIRFRVARTDAVDPMAPRAARDRRWIDLSKPVTLTAYGEWTKKSGLYELASGGGALKPLVYEDAAFSTPTRAAKADRYLFTRQTFTEFPDLRVSGPSFADAKKISNVNAQQDEFLWGHRVLFEYRTKRGDRAQGILAIPDDYKPGEKRPMIVSFYEKNSSQLSRYTPPSYLTGMGSLPIEAVSRGYITMLPDVYFHTGSSHSDMLDAVEAATKKVIEMGYVDPKRIGVHGHSFGGEGAAFIGTRSRMFAAVGVGAGVSDLTSDFTQSWGWSYQVQQGASGANGFDYYLYGQGRWGFSPWDKPEVYRFESALTHAPEVTAPILIMHGTADPTVSFSEGLNFYQALRYNNKDATLLAYLGEGHGLRGLANRRDLTIRYFQFFDHYLKGAPAPKWMTDGVPFLVKDPSPRDPR